MRLVCTLAAMVGATAACRPHVAPPPPPTPEPRGSAQPAELARALAAWHDDDDIDPLRAWVRAHPDAAQAEVVREVVALHDYDACYGEGVDEDGLRAVVVAYPDTVAGRIASARLVGDGLGRLRANVPSRELVDFLDGGDAWARTEDGRSRLPATDLQWFRSTHAPELEAKLASTLLADRCRAHMGYCNWWIAKRPDAGETPAITEARRQTWYERGHPTWRGREHARCAYKCAKTCRERSTSLDDGCYGPCYARCG